MSYSLLVVCNNLPVFCQALKKEEEKQKEADKILATDERKRKYNSMQETTMPTEMEMEAYRMKRTCTNDPMAQFLEN